jgi:hypothetical protein
MFVRIGAGVTWLGAAVVVLLLAASQASAVPTLQLGFSSSSPGEWTYDMTLIDGGGTESLSGLNIPAAYTLFGLDDTSTIISPSGWDSFAPLPPSVDELNYFSLSGASDVPIGGSLGGFSFVSATDPDTIDWDAFEADAIGGTSSTQIPLTIVTPEPATGLLLAAALAAQAIARRR